MKYKIGYTQGTYDLFHIGHLNLLKHAKEKCDYLIVGINTDELVKKYKNKLPIISEKDRAEIVKAIKYVDNVIITNTLDKEKIYEEIHFNVIFIGSDWQDNERWKKTEENMKKYNVDVIYLPHTDGISTTMLNLKIGEKFKSE